MADENTLLIVLGVAGAVGLSVWKPWEKAGGAATPTTAQTAPVAVGNGLTWLPAAQEVVGLGPNGTRQLVASHVTTEAQARQVAARSATPGTRQQPVTTAPVRGQPSGSGGSTTGSGNRPPTATAPQWVYYRSSDNRVWRADGNHLVYVSNPDELMNPDGTWKRILEGHGAEVDAQLRSQGITVGTGSGSGSGGSANTSSPPSQAAPPSVVNVPGSTAGTAPGASQAAPAATSGGAYREWVTGEVTYEDSGRLIHKQSWQNTAGETWETFDDVGPAPGAAPAASSPPAAPSGPQEGDTRDVGYDDPGAEQDGVTGWHMIAHQVFQGGDWVSYAWDFGSPL